MGLFKIQSIAERSKATNLVDGSPILS